MQRAVFILAVIVVFSLTGCGHRPARLINTVKEIPLSGGNDTIFAERSSYWDMGRAEAVARVDSNRQELTFRTSPGDVVVVTMRNMGGVPLKRDTVRRASKAAAERFFRTGTLDTNMHLTVEHLNPKIPETDVIVFIRNRDSVYREFLFYER